LLTGIGQQSIVGVTLSGWATTPFFFLIRVLFAHCSFLFLSLSYQPSKKRLSEITLLSIFVRNQASMFRVNKLPIMDFTPTGTPG
jgi:uncharacterized membrane protein YbaN (DUF454 family)